MRIPKFGNVRFALRGIWVAFKEETQIQWGSIIAILMIFIAVLKGVSAFNLFLFICLGGIVAALAMLNTAIERLCDKVEPKPQSSYQRYQRLDFRSSITRFLSHPWFLVLCYSCMKGIRS